MAHKLFTQSLLKYIPSLVIKRVLEVGNSARTLPEVQRMETVVMFSDISGFTSISEACSKMGSRGAEELVFCINRYMEGLVKCITKYGGDIIKFVGDAMIVLWPRKEEEELSEIVRRAVQSALEIQAELNNKRIMRNVSKLSVKIGIGAGNCGLLYVGGVFKRAEFFAVGDALAQALGSEHECTVGGQVIVSGQCWKLISDYFIGEHIKGKENIIIKDAKGTTVKASADSVFLRTHVDAQKIEKLQSQLKYYVPAAIIPYLELNVESFGAETRRLSIMFGSLGIDLSNSNTTEGLERIQQVVTTVQKCVYALEGSLNKLVMDDKGSSLICIWGLPPFAHGDDAARAVFCSLELRKKLSAPDINCQCNIGVSTGVVFAGVVGTSGSRREFSVIGDIVNLSARIMQYPKILGEPMGQIHVDQKTKDDASNKIHFRYRAHVQFKGKSLRLPVFVPVDPDVELLGEAPIEEKDIPIELMLPLHNLPFCIDRNSVIQYAPPVIIGRDKLLQKVMEHFIQLSDGEIKKPFQIIAGTPGSGKTLFARALCEKIKKNSKLKFSAEIFASHLNALSEKRYLNAWRLPLASLLRRFAAESKQSRGEILEGIIANSGSDIKDKLWVIEKLFNMTLPSGYKPESQCRVADNPLSFVKKEEYSEQITEEITKFIIQMFTVYFKQLQRPTQLIFFFDDAQSIDNESWKLMSEIYRSFPNTIFYSIFRQNEDSELELNSKESKHNFLWLNSIGLIDQYFQITGFNALHAQECISKLGPEYYSQGREEVKLMLPEGDPELIRSTEEELISLHMLQAPITKISYRALISILEKTQGNALCFFQFILSLLKCGYLSNEGGELVPTPLFCRGQQLDDWAFVDVPDIALRQNSTIIENIIKTMSIKDVICLKAASVLGNIFNLRHLKFISPLRSEGMTDLIKRANLLEERNILETIDDNGVSDMTCRFLVPFMRETLYQRMLYRDHKKGLHAQAAEYMLNNCLHIDESLDNECSRMIMHLLVAEDIVSETELSVKNKRMITIKKIANILLTDTKVIRMGQLMKEGEGIKKHTEYRYVVLTREELQYYHSEQEYHAHDPLGIIYLRNVGSVLPQENRASSPTFQFVISASTWVKKDITKEHREFHFGAKTEAERDEWITAIEYLKALAVVKNFQSSFGAKIEPPSGSDQAVSSLFDSSQIKTKLISEGGLHASSSRQAMNTSNITTPASLPGVSPAVKELKENIKGLFNYMMVHLVGHLQEHSMKSQTMHSKMLSQTPDIIDNLQLLANIEARYSMITGQPTDISPRSSHNSVRLEFPYTRRETFGRAMEEVKDEFEPLFTLEDSIIPQETPQVSMLKEENSLVEDSVVENTAKRKSFLTEKSVESQPEEEKKQELKEQKKQELKEQKKQELKEQKKLELKEQNKQELKEQKKLELKEQKKLELKEEKKQNYNQEQKEEHKQEQNKIEEIEFRDDDVEGAIDESVVQDDDSPDSDIRAKVRKFPILPGRNIQKIMELEMSEEAQNSRILDISQNSIRSTPTNKKQKEEVKYFFKNITAKFSEGKEAHINKMFPIEPLFSNSNGIASRGIQPNSGMSPQKELSIVELQRIRTNLGVPSVKQIPLDSKSLCFLSHEKIMEEVRKYIEEHYVKPGLLPSSPSTEKISSRKHSKGSLSRDSIKSAIQIALQEAGMSIEKRNSKENIQKEVKEMADNYSPNREDQRPYSRMEEDIDNLSYVLSEMNEEMEEQRSNVGLEEEQKEESPQKKYGFVLRNISSSGGDIFDIPENSVSVLLKIDEEYNIATCEYKGKVGIFPLDAFKIGGIVRKKH